MKDKIRNCPKGKEISRAEYDEELAKCRRESPKFAEPLHKIDWQTKYSLKQRQVPIRNILKAMVRKYQSEEDHDKFEEFVIDARKLYHHECLQYGYK